MKRSTLYKVILLSWWCLLLVCTLDLIKPVVDTYFLLSGTMVSLIVVASLYILSFWLARLTRLLSALFVYFAPAPQTLHKKLPTEPTVDLIYTVKGTFDPGALLSTLSLAHKTTRLVILDETSSPVLRRRLAYFAKKHHLELIRRPLHLKGKLTLLNYYLLQSTAEFFVVLLGDEKLSPEFLSAALSAMKQAKVGVVQGITPKGKKILPSEYQLLKATYGFLPYLSSGSLIRKKAYNAVEAFPDLTDYDPAFALALREKGLLIQQLPLQAVMGSSQLKKAVKPAAKFSVRRILTSRLLWYEKLDALLFLYTPSLTGLVLAYTFITAVTLPVYNYKLDNSLHLLLPTLLLLFVPHIERFLFTAKQQGLRSTLTTLFAPVITDLKTASASVSRLVLEPLSSSVQERLGLSH